MAEPLLTPYRPSNGAEGDQFEAAHCWKCAREDSPAGMFCPIHTAALFHELEDPGYPSEWVELDGIPTCRAFQPHGRQPVVQPPEPVPTELLTPAEDAAPLPDAGHPDAAPIGMRVVSVATRPGGFQETATVVAYTGNGQCILRLSSGALAHAGATRYRRPLPPRSNG